MSKEHPPHHVPVLLDHVVELLNPQKGESYLDLTAGYGGHASAILERTGNYGESILVDRDEYAIEQLSSLGSKGVRLVHADFVSAAQQLVEEGAQFSLLLIDLGVSSPQLDQAERGFSFTHDGPLDMRMNRSQGRSADVYVNHASKQELIDIIRRYGEEPSSNARRIADAIVHGRPINSTGELAELIKNTHRGGWKKTHPATRTFQALRIAVNDELRQVETILPLIPQLLKPGGRVGVISFHSLEDRLVKRFFKEQFDAGYEAEFEPVNKKPVLGATEDVHNPRARSAILRVAVKK